MVDCQLCINCMTDNKYLVYNRMKHLRFHLGCVLRLFGWLIIKKINFRQFKEKIPFFIKGVKRTLT